MTRQAERIRFAGSSLAWLAAGLALAGLLVPLLRTSAAASRLGFRHDGARVASPGEWPGVSAVPGLARPNHVVDAAQVVPVAAADLPVMGDVEPGEAVVPRWSPAELEALLVRLEDAVNDRAMERDAEAVEILLELQGGYATLADSDRRAVLGAISNVILKIRRPRRADHPALYRTAIFALGTIGPNDEAAQAVCADCLVRAWGRTPFTEVGWLATREDILENIGRCKSPNPKHREFLVDCATRSPIDDIKRGAGKALRHDSAADVSVRKQIFNVLLCDYATLEGKSKQSLLPGDAVMATATATLEVIRDPWNATLAALSGANHCSAADWLQWWNENKNDRRVWR